MAFKLDAAIVNQRKDGGSWSLEKLDSVGVWEDQQELKNTGDCPEGTFDGVTSRFESMTKAKPQEKKPMTFSWVPTAKEEKTLFRSKLRRGVFTITIGVWKDKNYWTLTFYDVELMKDPKTKSGAERVNVTYKGFLKHP